MSINSPANGGLPAHVRTVVSRQTLPAAAIAIVALTLTLIVLAGAGPASAAEPGSFGFKDFSTAFTDSSGAPVIGAGAHPYALTTTIDFESHEDEEGHVVPNASTKDVEVNLPRGVIVNPTAAARCTEGQLDSLKCSRSSAVGSVEAETENLHFIAAVYNVVPPPGTPAELGINLGPDIGIVVHIFGKVRTGGDYGLSAEADDIIQRQGLHAIRLTLWGSPTDPAHNAERGECALSTAAVHEEEEASFKEQVELGQHPSEEDFRFNCPVPPSEAAFLTMPTACSSLPLLSTANADAWSAPGSFVEASSSAPALTGCERSDFTPALVVQPETQAADTPTGLDVDLHVPQTGNRLPIIYGSSQKPKPAGVDYSPIAEANLKDAVVTLPEGIVINPSSATGLAGCSSGEIALSSPQPAACLDASKIGTVELDTPLLEHPILGAVYLAAQDDNPFHSLLALYIAVDDPTTGVVIKLAGHVEPDPSSGRLTTTFDENPQLPFEDLKLHFAGGPRAPLSTPDTCGTYTTTTDLTPWTAPAGRDAQPSSSFTLSSGPNGRPCPGSAATRPFAPSFTAGTTSNAAAVYSPFTVSFTREDGEQSLSGLTVVTPPGLLGVLKSVALCQEPQAGAGTCGPQSQIGHTTVAAGAGPDPVHLPVAGQPADPVYLTGPYKGAPFGLSVVVPAVAGPFNLGTVVVRAAIHIDPHTAALNIVSDPLPQILDGIPLNLRSISVTVDRTGFTFNPSSCAPAAVTATLSSAQGASASGSNRFQAADCAGLAFRPKLVASTQGRASAHKLGPGASLTVHITAKGGPQAVAGEANIRKVEVQLPKLLPARLTTLQQACTAAQFEANPAGCPKASDVGVAAARTPLLANPLRGPAYLVSHGGAAFPDLEIVLQGEGITLMLDGHTDIARGITYSRFQTVPDAPISSFELSLPEGSFSALASPSGNLCGKQLTMPTTITGQNGAVLRQATKIAVAGCPQPKRKQAKAKHTRRK